MKVPTIANTVTLVGFGPWKNPDRKSPRKLSDTMAKKDPQNSFPLMSAPLLDFGFQLEYTILNCSLCKVRENYTKGQSFGYPLAS